MQNWDINHKYVRNNKVEIIIKICILNKNLDEIKIKIRSKNKIIDRMITLNDSQSYRFN